MYKYILVFFVVAATLFLVLRDNDPVFASAEIIINAPIDSVWGIQTNLNNWSDWNADIESMHVEGEIGIGTVFVWKSGGISIESTITEYQPDTRIAWKGRTVGTDAYHIWIFSRTGNATRVYTEETFSGILPWLIPGTMRKELNRALMHGVEVLKTAVEQRGPGKPVEPAARSDV